MRRGYRGGHLGEYVDEYVDGRMDERTSRLAARHVLVCEVCRAEVAAERRIIAAVREVRLDAQRHACLVSGLLALGSEAAPPRNESPAKSVPLVSPSAPARYAAAGHRRRVVVARALTAVAACVATGVAITAQAVTPQRTAPAAPRLARSDPMTPGRTAPVNIVAMHMQAVPRMSVVPLRSDLMPVKPVLSGRMDP